MIRISAIALLAGAGVMAASAPANIDEALSPASPVTLARQGGPACLPPVTARGFGLLEATAKLWARSRWSDTVSNDFAPIYSTWANAHARTESCGNDGKIVKTWTCVVVAQPCKEDAASTPTVVQGSTCVAALERESGPHLLQNGAESDAVGTWQTAARNSYGALHSSWNKAQNKTLNCRHNNLKPGLGRRWRCIARGEPCS